MSRHPELKWAQRKDKVFLTVQLPDAKDAKVNLDREGIFSFSGKAGSSNNLYEIKLELFDKVNGEVLDGRSIGRLGVLESKINIGVRNIFCILEKSEKVWWKKLLRGDGKPPHYVKVDWDKWVDEDEDNGMDNLDLGGMDFSKFGGMGGDMGDEFEDSDDEEAVSKPSAGATAEGDVKMEEETEKNEGAVPEEKAAAST